MNLTGHPRMRSAAIRVTASQRVPETEIVGERSDPCCDARIAVERLSCARISTMQLRSVNFEGIHDIIIRISRTVLSWKTELYCNKAWAANRLADEHSMPSGEGWSLVPSLAPPATCQGSDFIVPSSPTSLPRSIERIIHLRRPFRTCAQLQRSESLFRRVSLRTLSSLILRR
jgi:hypothetical protein